MEVQHTIADTATIRGRGLFGGAPVDVTFKPAPEDHGVVFIRKDRKDTRIPALVRNVVKAERRTTLKKGEATIETCEHCMSAIAGLNIDNLIVEVEGPELPGFDGSAKPFLEALASVGLKATSAPRRRLIIKEPVVIRDGEAMIAAMPTDEPGMQVVYDLEYPGTPIGHQVKSVNLADDDYGNQLAPARTFALEQEAVAMKARGIGAHLSPDEVLVIGEGGPLGENSFRFPDEPVRHKIVDLIGDLYLLGAPIQGRILAIRSGHSHNHMLVRKLVSQYDAQTKDLLAHYHTYMDVKRLSRIMPHRYPMLLIDRVLQLDGEHRAVGLKNVTINEPFFQGHYPGTPIMPGVLIVEAMAQLSGVLIAQKLEHKGKIPVLLSLDKVKLRRPVVPGDQLILEAEATRVRSRIASMRCRAFVAEELAAEAEVKFMLVDDEQE